MSKTAIGWTDETWNPVRGCSRVSEGCRHCYAEQQAARIVRMGKGKPTAYDGLVKLVNGEPRWTGEIALDVRRLAAPLGWRAPRRVFVDSMSDLFYDRRPDEHIAAVFGVTAATPHITYQMLTKYADRMRTWFGWIGGSLDKVACMLDDVLESAGWSQLDRAHVDRAIGHGALGRWPLRNVWPGVSVEDRTRGVPRIDELRRVPAAVRMLSCEPLLEDLGTLDLTGIGWVIIGCESGGGARPARPEWFEAIAEQCSAAGVPLFVKQMMIDGVLRTDPAYFPPWLQRQDFPR